MVQVGTNRIKLVKVIVRIGCHLHHHLPMLKIIKMDKEQEGIIELVGQEYTKWFYNNAVPSVSGKPILNGEWILTRGEFINKCKTEKEFSEKWGLKIEERESYE
jgi:hypothetical protein